ncbi:DUF5753 domain-containing protein [Marinactinospora thermotolerans]|uniref:DUF5753 domain-containing protein n=1 Tax=Marinactinospora thermotolerans TaxID=531310 RepID=UPI00373FE3C9
MKRRAGRGTDPVIWAIIPEAAIRRLANDPDILSGQVGKLLEPVDSGRVELQVAPAGLGVRRHPGPSGPFTILSFIDETDVVYVEGAGSGNLFSGSDTAEEMTLLFGESQAAALSPDRTVKPLGRIRGGVNGSRLEQVQLQQGLNRQIRGSMHERPRRSQGQRPPEPQP